MKRNVQITYPFIQHDSPICYCDSAERLEYLMREKYYIGFTAVATDRANGEVLAVYCPINGYRTVTSFEPEKVELDGV